MRILRGLVFGLSALLPSTATPESCTQSFSEVGASFDLSPLSLGPRFNYIVKDIIDSIERNYTYVFNVCDNVGHVPDEMCSPELAPAYQIGDDFCHRLANDPTDAAWTLIDEDNPTQGVSMTYMGGDICENTNIDRKLTINFQCSTELGLSEFEHERVVEEHCHYSLSVSTVFGCPNECFVGGNRRLCSGAGFCGMDNDNRKPRCFCYEGHYGSACEIAATDGGLGATGVMLILAIVCLTVLLGGAIWMYTKVANIRRRKLYQLTDVDEDGTTVFSIDD